MVNRSFHCCLRFDTYVGLLVAASISACTGDASKLAGSEAPAIIRVDTITHLDFSGLPQAPDAPSRVFATPDGGWGVSSEVFSGMIQFFDQEGNPAGTYAKTGAGPDELGGQVFGIALNGQLILVDPANARLTVFDPGMTLHASKPIEGRVFSVSVAADRASILATGFFGTRTIGQFGIAGAADRFSGSTTGSTAREQIRYGAVASTGELWTIEMAATTLQIWDPDLGPPTTLTLKIPASSTGAPPPTALGVTAGGDGMVYVLVAVPDARWSADLGDDVDGIEKMFDTVVIAYDAGMKAESARTVIDEVCLPVEGGSLSCVLEALEFIRVLSLRMQ